MNRKKLSRLHYLEQGAIASEERKAFENLYRAVVLQAVMDAAFAIKKHECLDKNDLRNWYISRADRWKALKFLDHQNPDFQAVCEVARLNPARVYRASKALLADSREKHRILRKHRISHFTLEQLLKNSGSDISGYRPKRKCTPRMAKVLLFPSTKQ